jgi:hypothetical protein
MIKNSFIVGLLFIVSAWTGADVPSFTKVTGTVFGTSHVNCVTYGNGKFVAGCDDGKIGRSTDGITWTATGNSGFGSTQINAIAFGNGKFIAVGNDGKIVYSR